MRIVINTTNLVLGGGVQVALSVIEELKRFAEHEYFVFLSPTVARQVDAAAFPPNFRFYTLRSPAALRTRRRTVSELNALEQQIRPDVVLTVFGPSYWRPQAVHVCGFALGWLITPESPAHARLRFTEKVRTWLIARYKWHHFAKEVDFFWCETEDVRQRIVHLYRVPAETVAVAGNTHHAHFSPYVDRAPERKLAEDGVFRMLTVSAYYGHKNIEIIKGVIPLLIGKLRFCFTLTISQAECERIFESHEREFVTTVGAVSAADCPALYAGCDAMFLPSLLECFSASYPEAMAMGKPILTSDLSFASSLLGDSALYFDPLDAQSVASAILRLSSRSELYGELVKKGRVALTTFPTPRERTERLLTHCGRARASAVTSGTHVSQIRHQ